jgi:hypothetical protein
MSEMSFLPELKIFLLKNGLIYTVRKYKMSEAIVSIEGVGECKREPLGTIKTKEDLEPFVGSSGFDTVDAWWKKIKYFIPSEGDIKYLYRTRLLDESG